MRVPTDAKITKNWRGSFVQPVFLKVEGREKEAEYHLSAQKKKDLPESVKYFQKRVDGYAGGVEVDIEDGRVSCVSYMLF